MIVRVVTAGCRFNICAGNQLVNATCLPTYFMKKAHVVLPTSLEHNIAYENNLLIIIKQNAVSLISLLSLLLV